MGRCSFRDCFPLHVQIDSGVFVGSISADMAEPVGDTGKINTGFEKMNCRAMPDTVGMETFNFEGGISFRCLTYILCQNVSDPEPGERSVKVICEYSNRHPRVNSPIFDVFYAIHVRSSPRSDRYVPYVPCRRYVH